MSKNVLVELSEAMAEAVDTAGKSTVMVNARRRMPASGILYANDLVLTADHIVEREEDIKIVLGDGSEKSATLGGRDPGSDLAVLKVNGSTGSVAVMTKTPGRVGQIVLALGRPTTEGIQASLGTISAVGGPVRTGRGAILEQYLRTDSIPYPGFSGGPLVAADGSVVGINTSGLGHGASLTIPAALAWKIGDSLASHGHIRRGYLGIRSQTVEIPEASRSSLKSQQETGLLVVGIEKDSPASKGGLMVGDILTSVNGTPVLHHDELFAMLTGEIVGRSTPIEVLRGGAKTAVNLVIGERK
jgi:S1-C subfamily serine protease